MLNIIIVGAGEVGVYIATILSKENYNIILIDNDEKKLSKATWNLDIATRLGCGSDWNLLEELRELDPDILLAITDNDEVNLVSCSIAKHLEYKKTIARVSSQAYLNRKILDFNRIFQVDYIICPELLVSDEIIKYLASPGFLNIENFANGSVQMKTLKIPKSWSQANIPLKFLDLPKGVIIGLINRQNNRIDHLIFPHGDDCIEPLDEVTVIGERDQMELIHKFFGIKPKTINEVILIGGSKIAEILAKRLQEKQINVTIVEKNYEKCAQLAKNLKNTTILNRDGTDLDFLKSEKIGTADAIIGCTRKDEINILSVLLGKELGCEQALAITSNKSYQILAKKLDINFVVSPRISAANHILSHILSGSISSLVSLYENQAEILEIKVSIDSKVVGIPLSSLGPLLPKDFLIAIIQNRGRIIVGGGDRIISPGDTVIVITSPKHINEIEDLF
ncbi:MAG: Trk system potassium uptake protein TrkA-like protein 1 [Chlamydia sp. 32-24]|nr:MAG: Trk system potassium uptake protein TrkA-like protein 1 [Chlamydia sp. 32-24]